MPELTIHIGGRAFEVSCQEGEESFLQMASKMLDDEAQVLSDQIGRVPEARMLLMAGLMLADKTAAADDRNRELEVELAQRVAEIEELRAAPAPEPEQVEIIPPQVQETLEVLATQAEALADDLDARLAGDTSVDAEASPMADVTDEADVLAVSPGDSDAPEAPEPNVPDETVGV